MWSVLCVRTLRADGKEGSLGVWHVTRQLGDIFGEAPLGIAPRTRDLYKWGSHSS